MRVLVHLIERATSSQPRSLEDKEITRGHEEINGGAEKIIFGPLAKPSTEAGGARVMVAQVTGPRACC